MLKNYAMTSFMIVEKNFAGTKRVPLLVEFGRLQT